MLLRAISHLTGACALRCVATQLGMAVKVGLEGLINWYCSWTEFQSPLQVAKLDT